LYVVSYNQEPFIIRHNSSRPLDTEGDVPSLSIKGEAFINKIQLIFLYLLFQHGIRAEIFKVIKVISFSWSNHADIHCSHL
jgi:hypothetical protein